MPTKAKASTVTKDGVHTSSGLKKEKNQKREKMERKEKVSSVFDDDSAKWDWNVYFRNVSIV